MTTDQQLMQLLIERRFDYAFPEAKPKVNIMINENRMYITIVLNADLDRNDTSIVLHPLLKSKMFKKYDKHVRITCIFIEELSNLNKMLLAEGV